MAGLLRIESKFDFARAGVAVLRALEQSNTSMRYQEFARAIGLMKAGDTWDAWYKTQVRDILVIIAATERYRKSEGTPLDFSRIVTASGVPGAGFTKESRIIRVAPNTK